VKRQFSIAGELKKIHTSPPPPFPSPETPTPTRVERERPGGSRPPGERRRRRGGGRGQAPRDPSSGKGFGRREGIGHWRGHPHLTFRGVGSRRVKATGSRSPFKGGQLGPRADGRRGHNVPDQKVGVGEGAEGRRCRAAVEDVAAGLGGEDADVVEVAVGLGGRLQEREDHRRPRRVAPHLAAAEGGRAGRRKLTYGAITRNNSAADLRVKVGPFQKKTSSTI